MLLGARVLSHLLQFVLTVIGVLATIVKYGLNASEVIYGGWDGKGVAIMYLDFVTDLLRLIAYGIFFNVVCYYYGLPLRTCQSFFSYCSSLL